MKCATLGRKVNTEGSFLARLLIRSMRTVRIIILDGLNLLLSCLLSFPAESQNRRILQDLQERRMLVQSEDHRLHSDPRVRMPRYGQRARSAKATFFSFFSSFFFFSAEVTNLPCQEGIVQWSNDRCNRPPVPCKEFSGTAHRRPIHLPSTCPLDHGMDKAPFLSPSPPSPRSCKLNELHHQDHQLQKE